MGIGPDGVDYPGLVLFDAGQNVSASMIVPVDPATGTITVTSWAATDLAIDVIGSFTRPTRTWRYHYDTSGLRIAKELETADGSAVEWRQEHTWTATGGLPLLLAEHQGSDSTYVIYGPGGTPIYQINKTGEIIYLHQDHQGSVRLVTNANGTTRGAITYDAHGQITANTNPWYLQQPLLGYTGQYRDTETGYLYLRARHYDPTTGQFTSLDPLVAITEEPYGYVGVNPVNSWDPTGLQGWGDWFPTCIRWLNRPACAPNAPSAEELVNGLREWTWEHRGTIASITAAAVCVGSVGVGCALATVAAFSVRTEQAIDERGWEKAKCTIFLDAVTTATLASLGSAVAPAAGDLVVGGRVVAPADDLLRMTGQGINSLWDVVSAIGQEL